MNAAPQALRPVVRWLVAGCVLIACMVAIGGITRLTGSGLSITEWKPIMGALPPANEAQWQEAFDKYKRIPEYTLVNQGMDLAGFKRIFFWEYLHRNWGRLMGLAFIIPFAVFLRKGLLKGWLLKRSVVIMIGGGVVASLGWFMVLSGLVDLRDANGQLLVDVSHFRLAIHLCGAFTVFAIVWWTVLDIRAGRRSLLGEDAPAARWARVLLVLLAVQVVYGAFTAGLGAGRIYNTWPLMNGQFMPGNVHAFGDLVTDLTAHRDGVQFVHRNLAWLVAAAFVGFAVHYRREPGVSGAWRWILGAVLLQFTLGVLTLLSQVDLWLGVLHQVGALLLLTALLGALHGTGRRRV